MRSRLPYLAAAIVTAGLPLTLAGHASADTTTPSTPPLPTLSAAPAPSATTPPSAAPSPSETEPAGATAPIGVPAGNADVHQDSAGASATEIILIFAGGLVLTAGGTLVARRRA